MKSLHERLSDAQYQVARSKCNIAYLEEQLRLAKQGLRAHEEDAKHLKVAIATTSGKLRLVT